MSETEARPQQRQLACVLCQQRKVKCDRKSPCSNCVRTKAHCVPATLAPRKRRFAERELLQRLRNYEDLLRRNGVEFEPMQEQLNGSANGKQDHGSQRHKAEAEMTSQPPASLPESGQADSDIWRGLSDNGYLCHTEGDDSNNPHDIREDLHEAVHSAHWEYPSLNDHILFGQRHGAAPDLGEIHPDPVHIFRLWHVYLENVNPLLKVTHAPTLQGQVIEAASDPKGVPPNLAALLFGIYSMALLSLTGDDCESMFGTCKQLLMTRFRFGCQQALLNANFLKTRDMHCLTALFFYLVSVRSTIDPVSLSSLTGVAVRIARRLGLHSEAICAKHDALEAEMRRRLWWAIILFDVRISEMAQAPSLALAAPWDCRVPRNVNDTDLRAERKEPPIARDEPSDAVFVAIHCIIASYMRYVDFHSNSLNTALRGTGQTGVSPPAPVVAFSKMIEERHFRLLDDENPLHFMTRWTAKTFLAKFKLMEHYVTFSSPDKPPNDVQLDYFNRLAMNVIECDTRIFTTPMIKGFTWFMMLYYPFPAYVQLLQDLKKRPCSVHADRAWQVLSENALARSTLGSGRDNAVFRIQAALVTQAWDARVAAMGPRRPTVADVPRLVSYIKEQIERFRQETEAKRAAGEAQMNEASPSVGHQASSALFELNSQAELEDMMYWGLPVNSFQSSWTSNMSMHNVEGYAVSSNPTPQQLLDGFGI
ncbi:hypothetical protein S40293_08633 [Stachybotrys chartarum IBT 40293]|nr:hypothetical protein S40293_08633 [Stachybotrys chartarum IBT 40293]